MSLRLQLNPGDTRPKGSIGVVEIISPNETSTILNPTERIEAVREDIFKPGYFSVYDVMRRLGDVESHWDPESETHVVDSFRGQPNWWYSFIYQGGNTKRLETPVHRMDTFPYKDDMRIQFHQMNPDDLEKIYSAFRAEVTRRNEHGLVVPDVRIELPNPDPTVEDKIVFPYKDIEVKPHDFRADMFQNGVITGLDVMVSLAERGDIDLGLTVLHQFGKTRDGPIDVNGIWVTGINGFESSPKVGFLYEQGEPMFEGVGGFNFNRLHIGPDIRAGVPHYQKWSYTG